VKSSPTAFVASAAQAADARAEISSPASFKPSESRDVFNRESASAATAACDAAATRACKLKECM